MFSWDFFDIFLSRFFTQHLFLSVSEISGLSFRITIKKIISLLMHIQAFDDARFVATNFKDEVKKDSPASSPSVASPAP